MYCFKIKPNASYAGGCALIAANNVNEAIDLYCDDDYNDYLYDTLNCTCERVHGLDYDCEESTIIFDALYSE